MSGTAINQPPPAEPPAVVFPVPIVIDTREQLPYTFRDLTGDRARDGTYPPLMITTVMAGLASGDYSLQGFDDRIAIERKSLADLFGTLGRGRGRFMREMERLNAMDSAHLVIEADWSQILTLPPPRSQLLPKTVHRTAIAWAVSRYPNVHWWPMGCRELAEITTFRILERYYRNAEKKR